MLFKILVAVAVGWLGWRLWNGWGRPLPRSVKAAPRPPANPHEAEARAVLGVAKDAGPDEIRAAHRRLITSIHPDRGGSPELTRQVNAARDVLLKDRAD